MVLKKDNTYICPNCKVKLVPDKCYGEKEKLCVLKCPLCKYRLVFIVEEENDTR